MSVTRGPLPLPQPTPPREWVILVVDDEPDVLESLKQIIEVTMKGTKVITAPSGRVALDLLDIERIDAIVADFKMPGMDGIEFLYQARKRHPNVPRLMLTAFASEDLVRRAISDAFVDEFVPKMTSPGEFLDRLGRHLRYTPSSRPP